MRGGYRGIPKPKLPPHLKRVHVNARIQKWILDELKKTRKRPHMKVRPSYFGHFLGARVALQHSPILRKDRYKKHSVINFASII